MVGGSALREMVSSSLLPPEEGRLENLLFPFVFVPPESSGTHIFNKRAISYISGSQEGAVGGVRRVANTLPPPSPSLFASSQWCVVRGHHQAFSHSLCPILEQVSIVQLTQTPLRAASVPPELSPCVPPHCPTPGTSVVPLVPLARCLGAWLVLPSPSRWLIRTIRLGYAIQFTRRPP